MKIKMLNPNKLRQRVLEMVYRSGSGHIGGSFSSAEIVAWLYSYFDLTSYKPDRDRLVLSKGHAVPIIYAALRELNVLTDDDLQTFREIDSKLQGHPDRVRFPILDATTGSLGQGGSIAIGWALGYKMNKCNSKVFCILGDGECDEGSVYEQLLLAPKYKLDNLIFIVDKNGSQNDGATNDILPLGDLETKARTFGWETTTIDGHNTDQISQYLQNLQPNGLPKFVVANTIKGKGVSFMEHYEWHAKAPSKEDYEKALKELQ